MERNRKPPRIFFSVGEPSGDIHGANLIRQLKSRHKEIECVGYGGPKMAAAGFEFRPVRRPKEPMPAIGKLPPS